MNENKRTIAPKPRSGLLSLWLGLPLGILLLYVLSVGPAARLSQQGWISKASVGRIYWPMRTLRGTPLDRVLTTYVSWWLPPPQQVDGPFHRAFER